MAKNTAVEVKEKDTIDLINEWRNSKKKKLFQMETDKIAKKGDIKTVFNIETKSNFKKDIEELKKEKEAQVEELSKAYVKTMNNVVIPIPDKKKGKKKKES